MFAKLFDSCKGESPSSSDQLKQALDVLEKKEMVLQKKISIEIERAKEFIKAKNKQASMQCLKRKKYYEGQLDKFGSFQMRKYDQLNEDLDQEKSKD
ncbi:hypothetical protein LUZ60_001816 [Juncus effusus]|nr:hypothetical protein LUZ60_001816 [Juncus effusus]